MGLSILEVLQNAQYNLKVSRPSFQKRMGKEQLDNAILLLENGKDIKDQYDEYELKRFKKKAEICK